MKCKNKSPLSVLSSIQPSCPSPLSSMDILTFTKQPATNIYNLQTSSSKHPRNPNHTQTPQELSSTTVTTTIDIPPSPSPTMSPTTTPPQSLPMPPIPCTHPPVHALTCPTCIFTHNTARERQIRAYYDPIIADLESRIAIAVERLWVGEKNEFLKERLVGARGDLEALRARREGEVGGVWGR